MAVINGTDNNDFLVGTALDDSIFGGKRDDVLFGGDGNDFLDGGTNEDLLSGGNGNDTYFFDIDFGIDTIFNDTDGTNSMDFSSITAAFGNLNINLTSDDTPGAYEVTIAGQNDRVNILSSALIYNVTGGQGNDNITGNTEANEMNGGDGNDSLNGLAGNDTINGNAGNDSLNGGADDDTLDGGAGNDSYNFDDSWGIDTITGDASGTNALDFSAVTGDVTATLTSDDTVGAYEASVSGAPDKIDLLSSASIQNATGGTGNDTLTGNGLANILNGGDGNDTLNGEGGNDTLNGGSGDDELNGGDGNDSLFGNGDNDTLNGDGGNDFLFGNDGNDTLNGGDGKDFLFGNDGNDTLNGDGDRDVLYGHDGDDILNGGAKDDVLFGGDGNDTLNGGTGMDLLTGGNGDDTYAFSDDFGIDTIFNDNDGVNTLDFSDVTNWAGLTIDLNTTGTYEVIAQGQNDKINILNTATIHKIIAGGGDDTMTASNKGDNFDGGAGDDTVNGGNGDDTLNGGADNDTVNGGNGKDILIGGTGDDLLQGGNGNDTYTGFEAGFGNDVIWETNGGKDVLDLLNYDLADISSWSAVDSDFNGKVDQLVMDFGGGDSITINDYFDNSKDGKAGFGEIDTISFGDDADVDFAQVSDLIA